MSPDIEKKEKKCVLIRKLHVTLNSELHATLNILTIVVLRVFVGMSVACIPVESWILEDVEWFKICRWNRLNFGFKSVWILRWNAGNKRLHSHDSYDTIWRNDTQTLIWILSTSERHICLCITEWRKCKIHEEKSVRWYSVTLKFMDRVGKCRTKRKLAIDLTCRFNIYTRFFF